MLFLHNLLGNTDWKADLGGLVSKDLKELCLLSAEGLGEIGTVFSVPGRRRESSVGRSAGRQRGGQKMGKMLPIKLILEISSADINQEGEWLTGAGSGFCVADDPTHWLCVPTTGLGQPSCRGRATQPHLPVQVNWTGKTHSLTKCDCYCHSE